jgi:molybdopterin-guanine dinucleotide biosynthesis protein A
MSLPADESSCSAVILSGGHNSRMDGKNKAFLKIGSKSILDRIIETITPLFDEVLMVTREPELYQGYALSIVEDIIQSRSSLTGIHAGLVQARSPFTFVVPCDVPFLRRELVISLLSQLKPALDVIVPTQGKYFQPLCAIYSKRCIPPIEEQLLHNDFKIFNFFDKINLKTIPVETFRAFDPDLQSFFNVNTPAAYEEAQKIALQLKCYPSYRSIS